MHNSLFKVLVTLLPWLRMASMMRRWLPKQFAGHAQNLDPRAWPPVGDLDSSSIPARDLHSIRTEVVTRAERRSASVGLVMNRGQSVFLCQENIADFVAKKREMFLVQMSLDVKKAEILKLDARAKDKEEALMLQRKKQRLKTDFFNW